MRNQVVGLWIGLIAILIVVVSQAEAAWVVASKATVTASGTAVQLYAARRYCRDLVVKADPDNTGVVYIGGSDASAASEIGVPLGPDDVWVVDEAELSSVYIDSTVSGDKVGFSYRR